jgi:hypothetical protein
MARKEDDLNAIRPSSGSITNSSSRDAIQLNSKYVRNDIASISNFINNVIMPSYRSLTSTKDFPYDCLYHGISGETIVSWPEELGNHHQAHPIFWKKFSEIDLGRPKTIKESFQWVLENFNEKIVELQRSEPDLTDIHESLRCLLLKIEQLKKEVLTENYNLFCIDGQRSYEYTLSTHVYNIINQLTIGMNESLISPYNDPNPDYPQLSIPYDRITDRIEYAYQLKDIDYGEGSTKAARGQLLVWQNDPADPDNDGGAGAWVPKYPNEVFTDTDTKIQYIDELKDVEIGNEELENGYVLTWDETVTDYTDPNNTQTGAWVPRPLPDPTVDTRTEYLTELKDANIEYPLNDSAANYILKFNPESVGPTSGIVGQWEAEDLNTLIPELPDLTTNIGQRVGTITNDSTLNDVYSLSEIREAWLADHSLTQQSDANLDQNLDLIKRSASRFRAGANLIYAGEMWHSKLSGNTSNLNEVEFVPEIYLKQSGYIDGLSSSEKEQLVHGGYNAIPFVFINNFDIKMKELAEPNFKAIISYSNNGQIPLTGNPSLDLISQLFDETSIGSILNSNPSNKSSLLDNEINTNEPSRPIGSMKVTEKYTDENGIERTYYRPEKVLGVCRTDLDLYEIPVPGNPLTPNFNEDSEGNLTGEINPLMSQSIQLKVAKNVGIGVQHSGYSRIMVLGPYVHGDNLYICPAPILEVAGINYPYGICISDTFITTPLKDLFLGEKDILLSSTYPTIYSQANLSIYDLIADALTVIDSGLKDKILSCPVAFVTRDDSPFVSLDIDLNKPVEEIENHNIANIICRNLLGLNNTALQTGSAVYSGILNYFNNISSVERADYQENVLHAPGGSLATKYIYNAGSLHLPVCKISTGSFNHEGVKETINHFDWATYINPAIIDGYLNLAGLNLGLVVGQNGNDGTDGSNGMIVVTGETVSHPPKSDGESDDIIPLGYDLIDLEHNLYFMSFDRACYPTLKNLNFSFQIRIADLSQDVVVEVYIATKSIDWVEGDDIPLSLPTIISNDDVGSGNSLTLSAQMFSNDNTVIINNGTSKYDMDLYRWVSIGLRVKTTEENIVGLNDICSRIYTTLVINPN